MCGIAGFVDRERTFEAGDPCATALVRRMCDAIRHRGPDDEGVYVGEGAALGMRRLSIIDLRTGHQPIANEDGTIWIVFNGEIYNYRELRAELASRGHHFRTATDTETIVHAYEEWGDAAFPRLRGMFGLALWDRRTRTLLLARDRAGIKPLHFAEAGGRLIFGSEIKSILASGCLESRLDPAGLDHYLSFLYTPPDGSIFEGIRKLPPAHLLRWTPAGATIAPYWELPVEEAFAGTEQDAAAALNEALADAVRSHLVSDVPVGAFLSGGVDSSLVVGLMARVAGRVKTFSIGFDEPEFDELDAARQVARRFATDHHEFIVRPDAVSIVEDLVRHFDEPFADASAIPTWYVCQLASRHVTVVLSGDGGDELFGGYDRYEPHPRLAAFDRLFGTGGRRLAAAAWPWLPHGARGKNFLRRAARDRCGRYLDSIAFFQPDEKAALLTGDLSLALAGREAEWRLAARFERLAPLDWPSQMMRLDFETYLPEDVLTKVDRMSMAHSIESRVPLLDHRVVELAASLPAALKLRGGIRKYILKQAAAAVLPPGILHRPKQGFAVPVGVWFRGRLREVFTDILQSARTRQRGYFRPRFVDRLLHEHLAGRRDHTLRLWQLVMFELWHREYLDSGLGARDSRLGDREWPAVASLTPELPQRDNSAPLRAAADSTRP